MRTQIFKDGDTQWVKEDRLERFLACGWQLAQPAPKKTSKPKMVPEVTVEALAEVIAVEEESQDPPQDTDGDVNANH